jgi:hypothetical protein
MYVCMCIYISHVCIYIAQPAAAADKEKETQRVLDFPEQQTPSHRQGDVDSEITDPDWITGALSSGAGSSSHSESSTAPVQEHPSMVQPPPGYAQYGIMQLRFNRRISIAIIIC